MASRASNNRRNGNQQSSPRSRTDNDVDSKELKFHSSVIIWGCYILFNLIIYMFIHIRLTHSFPSVVDKGDRNYDNSFSEESARDHLNAITSFGPRVGGSHANENLTLQYIIGEIQKIEESSHNSKQIHMDVQTVSGSFHLQDIIKTNYYSVYEDLKNIVVKVTSDQTREDSLLINCHYDTVANSPGAGDNAVSCAVMLDVLRVLSRSSQPLLHDIIFLFNGAEENILQASHGFITKHKWRHSVKAFVNLDSAGAGGWELVFQTGPEHPWLVTAYAESAPHPFGTIIGQELFQTGLIPSDTDFRIFRDYGNIPGIDIAHVANGYIYHTMNDKPKFIPEGCLQRAGENLLSLVRNIASSPKLADPGVDRHGEMVFFDVVGLFMVHYPKRIGTVINCVVVGTALLYLFRKTKVYNGPSFSYIKNVVWATAASLFIWVVTLVTEALVALAMSSVGRSMFWFTNTFNIFSVFVVSGVSTVLSLHTVSRKNFFQTYNPWFVEELFFDASVLILSVITLGLTVANVATAYLFMFWVLSPLLIREYLAHAIYPSWKRNTWSYLLVTLTGVIFPLLITMLPFHVTCMLFIPIMGRSGTGIVPDIPIAMFSTIMVLLSSQFVISVVYVSRNMKSLLTCLWGSVVIAVLLVIFTPLGFPFNANENAPTLKRAIILHTDRNFYDVRGKLRQEDSGIWFLPFDFTHRKHMMSSKFIQESHPAACDGPYCGRPYLIPVVHLINPRNTFWYDIKEKGSPKTKVVLNLIWKHNVLPDVIRFSFQLTGPDHMALYIHPRPETDLVQWSLDRGTPVPSSSAAVINETMYWVYYSHGEKPSKPFEFYLDFKLLRDYDKDQPTFDLVVAAFYLHGDDHMTPKLQEYLSSLPEYVVPSAWYGSYNWHQYGL